MLGESQVAAPLMARRAAHGALRLAHRRFQPGEGVGVHLGWLRISGQPHRPAQRQLRHQTPVLGLALVAPAAPRPGQHGAMWRQRARQMAPSGHPSTVRQQFARPVLQDDQEVRPALCHTGDHAYPCVVTGPSGQAGAVPGQHWIPRYPILVLIGVPVSTVRPTVHSRSCDLATTSGKMARASSPPAPPGKAIW